MTRAGEEKVPGRARRGREVLENCQTEEEVRLETMSLGSARYLRRERKREREHRMEEGFDDALPYLPII
jgi:hypothetical protein